MTSDPLRDLPQWLVRASGIPTLGVAIWRRDITPLCWHWWDGMVGEFLLIPAHQSGRWLIDAGWGRGGLPGPYAVEWRDGRWAPLGYTRTPARSVEAQWSHGKADPGGAPWT